MKIKLSVIAYSGIDEASFDHQTPNHSQSEHFEQETQQKLTRSKSTPLWSRIWSTWFASTSSPPLSSPTTPSHHRLRLISRRTTAPGGLFGMNENLFRRDSTFDSLPTSSKSSDPVEFQDVYDAEDNAFADGNGESSFALSLVY